MSFETQKNFVGKTQKIILAEAQSERWISYIRFVCACSFLLYATFQSLIEKTALVPYIIQLVSALVICAYSWHSISHPKRPILAGNGHALLFGVALADILMLSLIAFSFYLNGAPLSLFQGTLFAAYLLLITFTALHYEAKLSLFSGAVTLICYTIVFFIFLWGRVPATPDLIVDYIVKVILIITISVLGSIISQNNSKTIQQVIASETRYHNLVHRLPEMLFTLDSRGNFLYSNIASHSILGIPAKVLIGKNIRSFLINPDSLRLDKGGVKGTFEIFDAEQNRRFVDLVIQAVNEDDKSAAAFDGLMSDVTDRELAICQREEMVNRLFQYQKMESLGTLASGMAHDFSNILQTVNDLTTIVDRESSEPHTKKRMKLIYETLVDARFLISELLALGRKKPLDHRSINLIEFFDTIIPQFLNQLGPDYSIDFECDEKQIWVLADPDYLKRIFQNLFGNARDAMPDGGVITVICTSYRGDDDVGMVSIKVCDTGTGIPPELTEKIFDPFFTTKKPGKGTGLGLALVRRIIMLHNGSVTVEKSGYEGTIFRLELPINDETGHDHDTKAMLQNRQTASVLLLDDDPKIREVLKIFLKEFKYSVLESSTSEEALQRMKNSQTNCDVLIMDWRLGNENPHAVIRLLRRIKKDLIVIVVSGYSPNHKSIEEMQITKWFTKPYDKNQLDIEIQRSLHKLLKSRES
jgi:PAS domain S-box-containing protein